jgi:hypothetical protein
MEDDFFHYQNFLSGFIDHVKAYEEGCKQLTDRHRSDKTYCGFDCYKSADKRCGRCKLVSYCSVEH